MSRSDCVEPKPKRGPSPFSLVITNFELQRKFDSELLRQVARATYRSFGSQHDAGQKWRKLSNGKKEA